MSNTLRSEDLILGMKRALNMMENSDSDLDFAIWATKKDIAQLEAGAELEPEDV